MGDNQEEELTEGVRDEIGEIRVKVQVLANELCVLRAEAVGERAGVDDVQQLVVIVAEFLAHKVIHPGWHVAADVVRNHPLPEVAAGALVAEDEAAGIHVETLVAAVVEATVGSRTQDCGEARLILEQSTAGGQGIHRNEHLAGLCEHFPQRLFHERILQRRDSRAVEIDFTHQARVQLGRKVLPDVRNYLGSGDIIGVVPLAHEAYPGLSVP